MNGVSRPQAVLESRNFSLTRNGLIQGNHLKCREIRTRLRQKTGKNNRIEAFVATFAGDGGGNLNHADAAASNHFRVVH